MMKVPRISEIALMYLFLLFILPVSSYGQSIKFLSTGNNTTLSVLKSEMRTERLVNLSPNVNTTPFHNAEKLNPNDPLIKPSLLTSITHTFGSLYLGINADIVLQQILANRFYRLYDEEHIPLDTVFLGIDSGYYKPNFEETLVMLEKNGFKTTVFMLRLSELKSKNKSVKLPELEAIPVREGCGFYISDIKATTDNPTYLLKQYESSIDFLTLKDAEVTAVHYANESFMRINFYDCFRYLYSNEHFKLSSSPVPDTISIDINTLKLTEHRYDRYVKVEITSDISFYKKVLENDLYIENLVKTVSYTALSDVSFDLSRNTKLDNRLSLLNALECIVINVLRDIQSKKLTLD